ncbi:MAG TPA: NAD(P)/FAD-dependent oxidoreductase [Mycobacteriales bacterium]|nr:NAD(P)/FAD-dependent oxidoreductase [Mycobacteriales bacterium]
MVISAGFYPNPVPGFIFTALVSAGFALVALWLAVREFGPTARRRRAAGHRPVWRHHGAGNGDRPKRILVVGGGAVGMYTALRLQKKLRRSQAVVTIVDPQARMTYQPFLPEAAAGSIEPRHVVVPLHRVLHSSEVLTGHVTRIDHASHVVTVQPRSGPPRLEHYDILVVAAGSIVRTMPIPGLAEHAIGLKTLSEAIYLRDHVLEQLETASSTTDENLRRRALTFAVAGGGYAGVEALAELEDMARDAICYFPPLRQEHMRWVLVEASGRIMPEVGEDMGRYTLNELTKRGIEVKLDTRVTSMTGGHLVLSNGEHFDCGTIVWTAGVRPNPVAQRSDLPIDDRGRIKCSATLQVEGFTDAWAAGDIAAVPDMTTPGAFCSPSAQHAVRQARRLGRNLVAVVRGREPSPYRHKYAGSVASLGLHKGVAQVYGVKLRGMPAWLMHRIYHVSRMPTSDRKLQVTLDWGLAMFFRRDIVSLGDCENPRRQFREAVREETGKPQARGRAVIVEPQPGERRLTPTR